MSQEASSKTFSDSWHRIARVRACLRPSVRAWRQTFRGVEWYVLQDSMSSHFFRVTVDAYQFLARLDGQRTVERVWDDSLAADPERMLSQEEVVQLLGQLYLSNLLHFDRPGAAASLFERYRKRRQREVTGKFMGFLSIRIPLIDPDLLLNRARPLIHALLSPWGAVVYLALLLFGLKVVVEQSDSLFAQGAGLLAPDNLFLLYVGFLLAKVVHEFSHAAMCKRFGGEVHVMGVMLLILAPMPYIDASASWGFRQGWKRLLVGAAGMIGEFALAAIAAMVWASTAPGTLNSVAYNIMFVASVSTLLFNINPLLRFDGYYMFIDLIGVPNLFQRSREQLRYLGEHYLYGVRHARPVARTRTEAVLLPLYGTVSLLYWMLLISTILYFIATQYLDLGILVALFLMVLFILVPLFKLLNYLLFNPRLQQQRGRAWLFSGTLLILTLLGLGGIDAPDRIRAQGVVEATNLRLLNIEESGFVEQVYVQPGQAVVAGQALLRLSNVELGVELQQAKLQREQLLLQELRAQTQSIADLVAIRKQRSAVETTIADLERRLEALVLVAPIGGVWVATQQDEITGRWLGRGTSIGQIIDPQTYRFVAVVPQVETHLFSAQILQAELRLKGQEAQNHQVSNVNIIPFEHGQLPSPALGMSGGGDIAVSPSDNSGVTAVEPFFSIYATIDKAENSPYFVHGRLGTLRLTLPPQPLLWQWERRLRQFMQRSFQVS